jgi:hypothetical protein
MSGVIGTAITHANAPDTTFLNGKRAKIQNRIRVTRIVRDGCFVVLAIHSQNMARVTIRICDPISGADELLLTAWTRKSHGLKYGQKYGTNPERS